VTIRRHDVLWRNLDARDVTVEEEHPAPAVGQVEKILDLLDHVIISDGGKYESFLEKGLIRLVSNPLPPQIKDKNKALCEQCGNQYEIDRKEEEEGYADFGRQYCWVTGRSKGLKKRANISRPAQFKEFTELMRKLPIGE